MARSLQFFQAMELGRQRLVASACLLLAAIVAAPAGARAAEELTIELGGPVIQDVEQRARIVDRREVAAGVPRQRAPTLSETELVVVALDRDGVELHRQVIPDPRFRLLEDPAAASPPPPVIEYVAPVRFPLTYPDDRRIRRLDIFEPRWDGTTWVLHLIGRVEP